MKEYGKSICIRKCRILWTIWLHINMWLRVCEPVSISNYKYGGSWTLEGWANICTTGSKNMGVYRDRLTRFQQMVMEKEQVFFLCLKWQCHEIFNNFFLWIEPFGSLIKSLKWFYWKIRFCVDIREKRDSAQCDTAQSRTRLSITLHGVRLGAVTHCAESGNWNAQKFKIV